MKQLLVRRGEVSVEQIPAPRVERGSVLVRVHRSCISIGTELSGVRSSGLPLYKRALQQPEKVRKAARMVREQGLARTRSMIGDKLSAATPIGYSASGIVIAVGEDVHDVRVGARVACAGSQCAHHAEVICVPRNLAVVVPDGLDMGASSTVTLGAIALQGVRRAAPTLGECFVVIGLGILGQLTVQLLKANGCRVIGIDPDESRAQVALEHGMDSVLPVNDSSLEAVARLTDGIGADGVIITASSPSDEIVSTAFDLCRKKARVVLVGDVGLNLRREDFYAKELDFFISTSYGPGRYDQHYEEMGLDYPVGYVRWTENRNLSEYLRLLADGRVSVSRLVEAEYDIDSAPEAYATLQGDGRKPLMVLLRYPVSDRDDAAVSKTTVIAARRPVQGRIGIAVIGAGGYAKAAHLPNIASMQEFFDLRAVVSRSGHNATATAKQFGAAYAGTDYEQVLADDTVSAVVITTRHDQHAAMALAALRAGKHVLVEKPLALSQAEVSDIEEFYAGQSSDAPLLMTGFNRRFSNYARSLRAALSRRAGPMILNYRMNAGYIPPDHWVHTEEGGGRNLGEACHIYDLFTFLADGRAIDIDAVGITPNQHYGARDNFVATLRFEDGSVASLTYTALGSTEYSKEQLTAYSDGRVMVLDDYRSLTFTGMKAEGVSSRTPQKGQRALLEAFGKAVLSGEEWPIPLWEQIHVAEIALRVEEKL